MFNRSFLSSVRRKALRRGVWYKALDSVERGILELSCRVVEEVRSLDLARVIVGILAKLRDASRSPYLRHVETFGVERAKALVEQAVSFGSQVAQRWLEAGFMRYLAFLDINSSRLFTYERELG